MHYVVSIPFFGPLLLYYPRVVIEESGTVRNRHAVASVKTLRYFLCIKNRRRKGFKEDDCKP